MWCWNVFADDLFQSRWCGCPRLRNEIGEALRFGSPSQDLMGHDEMLCIKQGLGDRSEVGTQAVG